jgi:glycosyltransferase involved in cell wall biosynthesis
MTAPLARAGDAALVSVVIPVHNRRARIARAVRSALVQDHDAVEVVVVDDGSTDGTAGAVGELAGEDPRVTLAVHGAKRGAQAARNTGIRAARGEWVAFLDSDDELFATSVSARLAVASARGVAVVHSDCCVLRRPGDKPVPFGVPPLSGTVYEELLRRPGPVFPGLLVRKSALERVGLLAEEIESYQEWDTSIRLARHFPFGFVPEPTFVYRLDAEDTISGDALRKARGYEQVVAKHRGEIARLLGRGELAQHYETAAMLYREAGDARRFRASLLAAIRARPYGLSLLRRIGCLRQGP